MKTLTKYLLSLLYSMIVPFAIVKLWLYIMTVEDLETIDYVSFTVITLSVIVSCLVMFTLLNVRIIPAINISMKPNLLIGIEIVDIERAFYINILCIRIKIKPLRLP